MLNLLRKYKVGPEEVDGIANGGPNDGFIVAFLDVTTADNISGQLSLQNMNFRCMPLYRQVVNVKLHWLPLYVGESFVKQFLQELAMLSLLKETKQVLGRERLKVEPMRVALEVTETPKMAIPHLVKFDCGASVLITMPGRPPLCLRCSRVGHMRRDCNSRPSFSDVVRRRAVVNHEEVESKPDVEVSNSEDVEREPEGRGEEPEVVEEEQVVEEEVDMEQEEEQRREKEVRVRRKGWW